MINFKKTLTRLAGIAAAAAMLAGAGVPAALAEDGEVTLYYGSASLTVGEDPTGGGHGNVFAINGSSSSRGKDVHKGNNPYIELPYSYLYDTSNGTYTLKKDFSISFDAYIKATGFRYAFYTGSDGYSTGSDTTMYGFYLIPDTGSASYIEGMNLSDKLMNAGAEEYSSLMRAWHNIEITRKDDTYTVKLDGKDWIKSEDSKYDYSSDREPVVRIGYTPYSSDPGASMYVDNITVKNGSETVFGDTADGEYNIISEGISDERSITVYSNISDGSETQKLIDASYSNSPRQMEYLDRGLVAVNEGDYGFISWRWLGTESADTKFNLYKNGEKLNDEPLNVTNYVDYSAKAGDKYSVSTVINGEEGEKCAEASFNQNDYFEIPLDVPAGGTVTLSDGTVEEYTYSSNDISVGDVDGDGQYEYIMKWEPSDARDSSHLGATGNTLIDAYDTDGTRLWRIDLGVNIRSGPHDTQFLVADFNLDGKAEVAIRTADGTIAGDGTRIGSDTDWRDANGKNLTGPLYMTVFNGETGAIIDSVDYAPASSGAYGDKTWDISAWGDDWGNRSERYLGGVGYFDGERPSMLFARGYYDRTALCAWTLSDDNKIEQQWLFDTYMYDETETSSYRGQGNHSLSIADVDYDGKDEVIYGAMALDDDGTIMYSTGLGHGDAQHVSDLVPSRPGLEVFSVHEGGSDAFDMRDARTGEILWDEPRGTADVGRGASADIDPYYSGAESWSADEKLVAADGTLITEQYSIPANFLIYWDGDLGREIQDSTSIYKWNHFTDKVETVFTAEGCHSNNSAKSNPGITADVLGDWREEAVYPTSDNTALRIYTTTTPTAYKIPTLMHDARYRAQAAGQNICYNQPTAVGYNLSYTTEEIPVPNIYTTDADGNRYENPDKSEKNWSIDEIYSGDIAELEIGKNTALVNGKPYLIDDTNSAVLPFIQDDRTMVPIRFVAEALGAHTDWDEDSSEVTITSPSGTVKMTVGENSYTVGSSASGGTEKAMDTAAVIENDRTFVPLRFVAEELGFSVYWNDGVIAVSSKPIESADTLNTAEKLDEAKTPAEAATTSFVKGEKFAAGQGTVLNSIETGHTGSNGVQNAIDCDFDTYMETDGRQVIQLELDYHAAISAVSIAFADGEAHDFEVYTKWDLGEFDDDLESCDGWGEAISTTRVGSDTDPELYIFPVPKYGKYVRIVLDPKNTGDNIKVSEIAAIVVQ